MCVCVGELVSILGVYVYLCVCVVEFACTHFFDMGKLMICFAVMCARGV